MSASDVRHDLPEPDAFTRTYWDAAAQGRLLLRRCGACGRAHHYPREFCPHCWSDDVVWEAASGRATLYTWSVVHRNDLPPFGGRTPYVAAVVDLAEGPRMMTEVVECAHEELRAGMELEVAFRDGTTGATGATGAAEAAGTIRVTGAAEMTGTTGTTGTAVRDGSAGREEAPAEVSGVVSRGGISVVRVVPVVPVAPVVLGIPVFRPRR